MGRTKPLALAVGVLLLAAPLGALAGAPPAPRILGVIPFYAPERMWALYAPFVDHLSKATREPWQLKVHASHDALIDDLCAGKVDVAFLGPVPLARANSRCGALPFLVALGADGAPAYRAVLVTSDPEVTSTAALRGKAVGFFKGSTAAHVLPVQMLNEAGLAPGSYQPVFVEGQDRLVSALLERHVAAAGLKSALFKRFEKEGGLRVLQTSRAVPNFSFAALPALPKSTRTRFAAALLALRPRTRPADGALVGAWDDEVRNGFVAPAPKFLREVLALKDVTDGILRDAP